MRFAVCVAGVFAVLSSGAALAQQSLSGTFDLERLSFNPGGSASLVANTGDGLPEHTVWMSVAGDYENQPVVEFRQGGSKIGAVVSDRYTTHVLGAFAPLRFLDVSLQLPVVLSQDGDNPSTLGVAPTPSAAVGTTFVSAKLLALQEQWGQPLDLSWQLGLGLPFGSAAAFSSDGMVQATPSVGAGKSFGILRFGGELGALLRAYRSYGPSAVGSEVTGALSITTRNAGPRGEVTARVALPTWSGGDVAGDLLAGARVPLPKSFEAFALAGMGLGQMLGNPDYRFVVGVSYALPLAN